MDDLISRQAAIDLATTIETDDYSGNEVLEVVEVKEIKELPSVTPQSFINKPCISEGVCREDKMQVLDKIKEEIRDNTYFINETTEKEGIDFETVEKIIDKYKAESEEIMQFNTPTHEGYTERCNHTQSEGAYDE